MKRENSTKNMPINCIACSLAQSGVKHFFLEKAFYEDCIKFAECPIRKIPKNERNPETIENMFQRVLEKYAFASLYIREPQQAFENAIRKKRKPECSMYMHSDMGFDFFKDTCTRHYMIVPYLDWRKRLKLKIVHYWYHFNKKVPISKRRN